MDPIQLVKVSLLPPCPRLVITRHLPNTTRRWRFRDPLSRVRPAPALALSPSPSPTGARAADASSPLQRPIRMSEFLWEETYPQPQDRSPGPGQGQRHLHNICVRSCHPEILWCLLAPCSPVKAIVHYACCVVATLMSAAGDGSMGHGLMDEQLGPPLHVREERCVSRPRTRRDTIAVWIGIRLLCGLRRAMQNLTLEKDGGRSRGSGRVPSGYAAL